MTMQRERYPVNWEEISQHIRFERAGGRCEECGVKHNAMIVREPGTGNYWYDPDELYGYGVMDSDGRFVPYEDLPDGFIDWKRTRVILTVHHIGIDKEDGTPGSPHDKQDCRPENLIALCQRCHLIADGPEHVKAANITKAKKRHAAKQAAGQRPMFQEGC